MTDLEKFIELYKSFGIKLKPYKDDKTNFTTIFMQEGNPDDFIGSRMNVKKYSVSNKFEGYSDFFSMVDFDKDGKFIKQGFWE